MPISLKYLPLAVLAVSLSQARPAWADYVENFDELSNNAPYSSPLIATNPRGAAPTASQAVPLVTTNGGLTVTYTDPGTNGVLTTSPLPYTDPYGYVVRSNQELDPLANNTVRFNFASFSGNMLLDFGNDPLKITLSAAETGIQFNFGLRFPSSAAFGGSADIAPSTSLILNAYLNGVLVGTSLYDTTIQAGHEFEEGVASFSGVSFNEIDIVSTNYNYLLYNGHGPSSAPVSVAIDNVEIAEPASWAMMMAGLGLLGSLYLSRPTSHRGAIRRS